MVNWFYGAVMTLVTDIMDTLGDIADGIGGFLAGLFKSIAAIFYDSTATENKITFIGTLALIGVVFALALWCFRFILKLFKLKG